MRQPLKLKSQVSADPSRRTYRERNGTDWVACREIQAPEDLLRLAAGIDRIELREPPNSIIIPDFITGPMIEALRCLSAPNDSADPDAERTRREMQHRLANGLARIRIRYGRQLLAGVTRIFTHDRDQHLLVLVFVKSGITRCDWLLAA
jgi:hypothetical protein